MSSWPSAKARRVRRSEANRLAPRPHGGLPQDNEKGRMGGLPILVPRFRGTRPGDPGKSLKEDGPSARRSVIGPHAPPKSSSVPFGPAISPRPHPPRTSFEECAADGADQRDGNCAANGARSRNQRCISFRVFDSWNETGASACGLCYFEGVASRRQL
jgi:hypothetical protein